MWQHCTISVNQFLNFQTKNAITEKYSKYYIFQTNIHCAFHVELGQYTFDLYINKAKRHPKTQEMSNGTSIICEQQNILTLKCQISQHLSLDSGFAT